MRGLLKILLLSLRLVLGIAIGVCRFFCICSAAMLSVLSSILFLLSLAALLVGHMQTGVLGLIGAFLISPFGFPKAASWMIDRIDDLRAAVTAI